MKKIKFVCLAVLIIAVAAVLGAGLWQKDNIVSFVNSFRYSENEIAVKLEDNNKKMQDLVDKTDYIDIRGEGLTAEEENALKNNEISVEDAIKIIRGQTTLEQVKSAESTQQATEEYTEKPTSAESGQGTSEPNEKPPQPSKQDEMKDNVSNIVAELYVVKADFINRLEAIGTQAYNDYKAQGGTKSSLTSIMESYTPAVGALESECDQKVNSLLAQLESELKKGGGDLSLVNEIRQYYYNEKSLKKSYYLNKYMN